MRLAYSAMKSATWGAPMYPSGSLPSYPWPGRRHCQFGVSSLSESHRSRRQELPTSLRSRTTWSIDLVDRHRLMASPLWPAPRTTVDVCTGLPSDQGHGRQLTSTLTFVGFVMMSYTADRFCDCATSALISSGVASASIV